jgi:NAD(P)-dependent dehydrogenase (short-subunit alcohol dehydrogenase family)
MGKQFNGKTALVTGAAGGIGRATAVAFAEKGAGVVVSDISVEGGEETAQIIKSMGGEAFFLRSDVSKSNEIETLINAVVKRCGSLDVAVNNAGIEGDLAPIAECSEENWARVIAVNLTGVWRCMKHEITQMLKQGGGAIVNMASIEGLIGFPGMSPYVGAKHGVNGITKTAALEYGKAGIRVNSVCPGIIDTGMIDRLTAPIAELDTLIEMSPAGRKGRPEEIAKTVVWLCSDEASFVNGHHMVVDGGYIAQ